MQFVNWLRGKKMYIGAGLIAVSAIASFLAGKMDASSLTLALGAAISIAGLSSRLKPFLSDATTVIVDLRAKNLEGALGVAASDAAVATGFTSSGVPPSAYAAPQLRPDVSAAPPAIPGSSSAPLKLLILISILAAIGFASPSSAFAQKPNFTEFRGTQESPMCAVKVAGRYEFYRCGNPTEAQKFREARSTVWVDGFTPRHRTVDAPFVGMSLMLLAATIADIAATQSGIRRGVLREGNPLMGQSLAQQCAVGFGFAGLAIWASHHRKAAQELNSELGIAAPVSFWNRLSWRTPLLSQTLAHLAGAASAEARK